MAAGDEPTLAEIARTLARVESKLDANTADHEERLRKVERWTYMMPAAAVTSIASIVVAFAR